MSRIQGVLKGKATDEPLSRLSTPKFTKTSLSFKCTFSLLGGESSARSNAEMFPSLRQQSEIACLHLGR
jgi:hypothetical protein